MKNLFIILFVLLLSIAGNATESAGFCKNTTYISEFNVLVCHRVPISDVEITNISVIIKNVKAKYSLFSNSNSLKVKWPKRITIVILTNDEINNKYLFPNYDLGSAKASARFLPIDKIICISRTALSLSNPDLPHELAHLFNLESGINNHFRDERLAYAFEKFYFER